MYDRLNQICSMKNHGCVHSSPYIFLCLNLFLLYALSDRVSFNFSSVFCALLLNHIAWPISLFFQTVQAGSIVILVLHRLTRIELLWVTLIAQVWGLCFVLDSRCSTPPGSCRFTVFLLFVSQFCSNSTGHHHHNLSLLCNAVGNKDHQEKCSLFFHLFQFRRSSTFKVVIRSLQFTNCFWSDGLSWAVRDHRSYLGITAFLPSFQWYFTWKEIDLNTTIFFVSNPKSRMTRTLSSQVFY